MSDCSMMIISVLSSTLRTQGTGIHSWVHSAADWILRTSLGGGGVGLPAADWILRTSLGGGG
eukprot:2218179-Prymnesium_polylepis.1